MIDVFTLLSPLITAALPSPTEITSSSDTPDTVPTLAQLATHYATGLPVTQATEVYALIPSRHFCRVRCPFCAGQHSHGVDLRQLQDGSRGVGPRKAHCARSGEKAAVGGDYWIALDEWVGSGCRIEKRVRLVEGDAVWL
jgi:hypothetical protein